MNRIATAFSKKEGLSKEESLALINRLVENTPLINISIPVNIEKWDPKTYKPLVAFLTHDYESEETKQITAFDSQGVIHYLDAKKAPNIPVIVVDISERVRKQADGSFKAKRSTEEDLKKQLPSVGAHLLGTNSVCTFPQRSFGNYLYLTGMSSDDISVYEGWARGAPEIAFRAFAANVGSSFSSMLQLRSVGHDGDWEPDHRSCINGGQWWRAQVSIAFWQEATYGQTVLFYFYEVDSPNNNQKVTLSQTFKTIGESTTTLTTEFSIGGNAKIIGPISIDYRNCPPHEYSDFGYYDVSPHFFITLNPYTVSYSTWCGGTPM